MENNFLAKLCAPSVALMNKLKYPVKVAILGSLVLVMSASIIAFLLNNLESQANFSIKERHGVEYINPLKNLFLSLHKYKENNPSVTKASINEIIQEIDKYDKKYNKEMKVEDKWQELKQELLTLNKSNVDDLISQTQAITDNITNQSNLILDPDLDTYYLMDSYCLRFSNIIGKIFTLKNPSGQTITIIKKGKKGKGGKWGKKSKKVTRTSFNKVDVIKTNVLLEEQNEILKSNLAVIYGFNPSTKTVLDEVYNNAYNSNKEFIDLTNKVINGAKVSPVLYKAKADKAISDSKKADEVCAQELYDLAGIRVKKYKSQEPISVLITVVSLLVLGYLAAGFYLSLVESVSKVSSSLSDIATGINNTTGGLSEESERLAADNNEQAASIQETAATLEEMTSMVQQNTNNTKQATALAHQAKDASEQGTWDMEELMSSMSELKSSSDQIARIIKVIDDIAFQTNLLALNAAVEAARAGEAGKGFAVVAEEVRNLAQRSAQAAKDTSLIIEGNVSISKKGLDLTKKTSEALQEINLQVQKVNEIISEVAVATEEQSQGISQINIAVNQMSTVTQNNVKITTNNALVIRELSQDAKEMEGIVQELQTLINSTN